MRAFLCGSGSTAAMATQSYCARVVEMTGKPPEKLLLAYLGTPMYDLEKFRKRLTDPFIAMGVKIHPVNLVETQHFSEEDRQQMLKSDIILVSGGNTLYAMDLWRALGVVNVLVEMKEKAVFCGGSAGANCWFDGGHSDSMDPMTFRRSCWDVKNGGAMPQAWPVSGVALRFGNRLRESGPAPLGCRVTDLSHIECGNVSAQVDHTGATRVPQFPKDCWFTLAEDDFLRYHDLDIALFFGNLRANCEERYRAFLPRGRL